MSEQPHSFFRVGIKPLRPGFHVQALEPTSAVGIKFGARA
jgi:hypothetical protein